MATGTNGNGGKQRLMVTIVVFQTVLLLFCGGVLYSLRNHERRIDALETRTAPGIGWTLTDQREHEREEEAKDRAVAEKLTALLVGQAKIKAKLGVD